MKYCVNCGVEIDEKNHRFCPLCNTIVLTDAEIETLTKEGVKIKKAPRNEVKKVKVKRESPNVLPLIFMIILLTSFTAILTLVIVDLAIVFNLTWSLIPIISIILFVLLFLPFVMRRKLYWFYTFDTILLIIYFLLLNILINQKISWSYYVVLSITLLWVFISTIFLNKIRGFVFKLTCVMIATTIFILLIAIALNNRSVFSRLVLPLNGMVFILSVISYLFIKTYIYKWHVIVTTITINTSILCICIDLLINKFLIDRFILKWSHFVLLVLIPVTLFMFYIGNRYKINKYLIKKFHV